MNATKAELVRLTSAASGRPQSWCLLVIEELLKNVAVSAVYDPIEIRGFGTFYTKERKPRPARNPRTGEVVWLANRCVLLFRYSIDLINRIAEGRSLPNFRDVRGLNLLTLKEKNP